MKNKIAVLVTMWCLCFSLVPHVNAAPVGGTVGTVSMLGQVDVGGAIMDAFYWFYDLITGFIESQFGWIFSSIKDWVRDFICRIRMAAANALGWFFCIRCVEGAEDDGELGGIFADCHVIPDCNCTACVGYWLGPYKFHLTNALDSVLGTAQVFSKFIPWQLWAVLMAAHVTIAAMVWAAKMAAQLGPLLAMV